MPSIYIRTLGTYDTIYDVFSDEPKLIPIFAEHHDMSIGEVISAIMNHTIYDHITEAESVEVEDLYDAYAKELNRLRSSKTPHMIEFLVDYDDVVMRIHKIVAIYESDNYTISLQISALGTYDNIYDVLRDNSDLIPIFARLHDMSVGDVEDALINYTIYDHFTEAESVEVKNLYVAYSNTFKHPPKVDYLVDYYDGLMRIHKITSTCERDHSLITQELDVDDLMFSSDTMKGVVPTLKRTYIGDFETIDEFLLANIPDLIETTADVYNLDADELRDAAKSGDASELDFELDTEDLYPVVADVAYHYGKTHSDKMLEYERVNEPGTLAMAISLITAECYQDPLVITDDVSVDDMRFASEVMKRPVVRKSVTWMKFETIDDMFDTIIHRFREDYGQKFMEAFCDVHKVNIDELAEQAELKSVGEYLYEQANVDVTKTSLQKTMNSYLIACNFEPNIIFVVTEDDYFYEIMTVTLDTWYDRAVIVDDVEAEQLKFSSAQERPRCFGGS